MTAFMYLDTAQPFVASDLNSEKAHTDLTRAIKPSVCSWSPLSFGNETKT